MGAAMVLETAAAVPPRRKSSTMLVLAGAFLAGAGAAADMAGDTGGN